MARRILSPELNYVGCDIVPGLVAHNTARFATERIEFRTLDLVTDSLPNLPDDCKGRRTKEYVL